MAYDLEEQEQMASMKAWWNKFGNLITWGLTIVLASYAAWSYWNYYQTNQAAQGSQLYEELQKAAAEKEGVKVQRAANDLEEKFGKTAYAQMGALTAAKVAFDAKDMKAAKMQLQWVIDHGIDGEYNVIAKIRLAGILLDEKAYDEGLKLLSGEFPAEFAGSVADRKGDILVAQNKIEEARAAYQVALDKVDKKNPGHQLIQLKFDAVGGESTKTVADKSAP